MSVNHVLELALVALVLAPVAEVVLPAAVVLAARAVAAAPVQLAALVHVPAVAQSPAHDRRVARVHVPRHQPVPISRTVAVVRLAQPNPSRNHAVAVHLAPVQGPPHVRQHGHEVVRRVDQVPALAAAPTRIKYNNYNISKIYFKANTQIDQIKPRYQHISAFEIHVASIRKRRKSSPSELG